MLANNVEINRQGDKFIASYKIPSWKHLKTIARGNSIILPGFIFREKNWFVCLFPNGINSSKPNSLSIYLYLPSSEIPVELKWMFVLKTRIQDYYMNPFDEIFDNRNRSWGCKDFINHAQIEYDCRNDDKFILQVLIQDRILILNHVNPLTPNLINYNPFVGNMIIQCKDQRMKADRAVLLQDPLFSGLIQLKQSRLENAPQRNNYLDGDNDPNIIDFGNFSAVVVKHLLEIVYSGVTIVPHTTEARLEFYHLAKAIFNMKLCDMVEKEILRLDFTPDKIVGLLIALGGEHSHLRDMAISYYNLNKNKMLKTKILEKEVINID